MITLKNTTNIDSKKIREIINFVRPQGLGKFDVRVSNTRGILGWSVYPEGSHFHSTDRPFIVARITPDSQLFPIHYFHKPTIVLKKSWNQRLQREDVVRSREGSKIYVNSVIMSREEALVYIIAYGARYISKPTRRVWGARGRYSAMDAYSYGVKMMRKWRRKFKYDATHLIESLWNYNIAKSPTLSNKRLQYEDA